MGDQHDGPAFFGREASQQLHHFLTVGRVQRCGRLVGKDQIGFADEGSGQGDTLTLSGTQIMRLRVDLVGQSNGIEQGLGSLPCHFRGRALQRERHADVVDYRQAADQVKPLKDETEMLSAERGASATTEPRDVMIEDADLSLIGREDTTENGKQGRLAAARRPGQINALAARDRQIDPVENRRARVATSVGLVDILDTNRNLFSDILSNLSGSLVGSLVSNSSGNLVSSLVCYLGGHLVSSLVSHLGNGMSHRSTICHHDCNTIIGSILRILK